MVLLSLLSGELLMLLLPVLVAGAGAALILGVRPGGVFGFLGMLSALVILSPVLTPLVVELMGMVPPWVQVLILVVLGVVVLRSVLGLVVGRRVGDTILAGIIAGVISLVFAMCTGVVRQLTARW
jgi:hypothetical protein